MSFLQAYTLQFDINCSRGGAEMILIQKSRGACAWAGAGSHNVDYDLELKWIILLSKGLWECFIILFAAAGLLSHCMENRYVGIRQVGIQSTLFNVLGNTLQLFFNTWLHLATLLKHFEALFEELVPKSSDQREKPVWMLKTPVWVSGERSSFHTDTLLHFFFPECKVHCPLWTM